MNINPKTISFEQWFYNNYPDQKECEECNNGKVFCEFCNGEGKVECDSCDIFINSMEDGEFKCAVCNDGYVKCEECDDGFIDCQECSGTNIDNYYYIKLEYTNRLESDLKRYKEIMKSHLNK